MRSYLRIVFLAVMLLTSVRVKAQVTAIPDSVAKDTTGMLLNELLFKDGIFKSRGFAYRNSCYSVDARIDIPNLFEKIIDTNRKDIDRVLIRSVAEKYGILSSSVDFILTLNEERWNSLPTEVKRESILLAARIDHLNRESTKKQITENFIDRKLINPDNIRINEYLNNEIELSTLMDEIIYFRRITIDTLYGSGERVKFVKDFYSKVLNILGCDFEISSNEDTIRMRVDSNYYLKILANRVDQSSYKFSLFEYDYNDTIITNSKFYNSLLDVIYRIKADNPSDVNFAIYEFSGSRILEVEEGRYHEVLSYFPEFKAAKTRLYFTEIPVDICVFEEVPVSFSRFSFSSNQMSFGNMLWSVELDSDVIQTKRIKMLLKFMQDYSCLFHEDDEYESKKYMLEYSNAINFFKNPEEFIQYYGVKRSTLNDEKFDRGIYKGGKGRALDAIYLDIWVMYKNDFQASSYRYEPDIHKEVFFYNDKKYFVTPGYMNMIDFINANVNSTCGRKFVFDETTDSYYYFSDQQFTDFKNLFPNNYSAKAKKMRKRRY